MNRNRDLQLVYKADGQFMGESIKAFLQSHGIDAYLDQTSLGSVFGGMSGEVCIWVPNHQAAEARKILRAMEAGEYEDQMNEGNIESPQNEFDYDPSEWVSLPDSNVVYHKNDFPELQKKNILILSLHNRDLSLMIEAYINHELGSTYYAISAGINETGFVHPFVITTMAEQGIYFYPESKSVDDLPELELDTLFLLDGIQPEEFNISRATENLRIFDINYPDLFQDGELDSTAIERFRQAYAFIAESLPQIFMS